MKTSESPEKSCKEEEPLNSYRQEFEHLNPQILKTQDLRPTESILDEIASPEPPRESILLS